MKLTIKKAIQINSQSLIFNVWPSWIWACNQAMPGHGECCPWFSWAFPLISTLMIKKISLLPTPYIKAPPPGGAVPPTLGNTDLDRASLMSA